MNITRLNQDLIKRERKIDLNIASTKGGVVYIIQIEMINQSFVIRLKSSSKNAVLREFANPKCFNNSQLYKREADQFIF